MARVKANIGLKSESKLSGWLKALEVVNKEYDITLDEICALQFKLEVAETRARKLLREQSRLEEMILHSGNVLIKYDHK